MNYDDWKSTPPDPEEYELEGEEEPIDPTPDERNA